MKVRKSIKKPKFLFAYFGSLFIVTIILACMGLIAFGFASYLYNRDSSLKASIYKASMKTTLESILINLTPTSQNIADVKSELLWEFSQFGDRYKIYYKGEEIANSSQTAIMIYYDQDKEDPYYLEIADKKYLEYFKASEFSKYWKTFSERIEDNAPENSIELLPKFKEAKFLKLVVREAYVDCEGNRFIPIVCEIYDHDNNLDGSPVGPVVSIPIEKGSKIPKGYTYYKSNGYFPGSSALINGFDGEDKENEYGGLDYLGTGQGNYSFKGTPLKIIPFTTVYGAQIRTGICLLFTAALGLSLIPATIVYNVQKRNYEIFEYRRKITDAMAHDLKSPMAAISAFAENLSDNVATDKREYYAGKIEEKVSQMNKMVNDILEFSKSENSPAVINKVNVDIGDVIWKAVADNEHTIDDRSLKINCDKKNITIQTDLKLFRQAVSNLINNAVLYSKEGTAIDITFDEKTLEISNIPAEKVANAGELKQPFVKGSTERGTSGSGLGLAIAENNLAMLGYKLDISSDEGRFIATVKL